jgi:hypothetical protein
VKRGGERTTTVDGGVGASAAGPEQAHGRREVDRGEQRRDADRRDRAVEKCMRAREAPTADWRLPVCGWEQTRAAAAGATVPDGRQRRRLLVVDSGGGSAWWWWWRRRRVVVVGGGGAWWWWAAAARGVDWCLGNPSERKVSYSELAREIACGLTSTPRQLRETWPSFLWALDTLHGPTRQRLRLADA